MLIAYKVKYQLFAYEITEIVSSNDFNEDKTVVENLACALAINQVQILSHSIEFGVNSDIKDKDLSIVLISLYSATLSGKNLNETLTSLLNTLYNDKKLNTKLNAYKHLGLTLSEILKKLNVNSVIVSLITTAENTGKYAPAFEQANDYLAIDSDVKKATKTGAGQSSLYMIIGFFIVFIAPVFIVDFFNDMFSKMNKEPTQVVNYLNFMSDNILIFTGFILTILTIIVISIFNKNLFDKLKELPIFSNFDKLAKIKKTIAFIPFYQSLNQAGINDESIVKNYKSIDRTLSEQLLTSIKSGLSLTEAIKKSDMDKDSSSQLASIMTIDNAQAKSKAFSGITKLFIAKAQYQGKTISTIFKATGYSLIISGIFIMVLSYSALIQVSL